VETTNKAKKEKSTVNVPNSDDYLLRPFSSSNPAWRVFFTVGAPKQHLMRAGRGYCNATQAKTWAKFPRPFGRNQLQSPTGSQAKNLLGASRLFLPTLGLLARPTAVISFFPRIA
jgi:hypothetical protein